MGWAELRPKKTIKATHRERMANNEFNAMFGEVEIDDSYDLDKFMEAEIDFEHIYKKLGLHNKKFNHKLTFRVRKIKARNVLGRYYPAYRTLVVDVKRMDSFAHELGHLLDYEWNGAGKREDMLSWQKDFYRVRELYIENFTSIRGNRTAGASYFLEPTEIFARTFELWLNTKFGDTMLTEQRAVYSREHRKATYPLHNEELMAEVDKYFTNLFSTIQQLRAVK